MNTGCRDDGRTHRPKPTKIYYFLIWNLYILYKTSLKPSCPVQALSACAQDTCLTVDQYFRLPLFLWRFIWIFFRKLFLGISSFFFAQRLHCHCCRLLSPCHYGRFPFSSAKPVMATSAGLMVYYTLLVIYKKKFFLKRWHSCWLKKQALDAWLGAEYAQFLLIELC